MRGRAKITFGTGGMLDLCTDDGTPAGTSRSPHGTYPLPLWSRDGDLTWGVEGIMLSAGTNVDWLRDDLGLIATSEESHDVASACQDSDGVVYVPALLGLGTPHWDYGARGSLFGITRGTERRHVVRAVLEGIAHRGADLVEAAEADTGVDISSVRIDGGMSTNPTFVQAVADATGRPIEIAPSADSTTIGAAFVAGLGVGVFGDMGDLEELWQPGSRRRPVSDRSGCAARPLAHGCRTHRSAGFLTCRRSTSEQRRSGATPPPRVVRMLRQGQGCREHEPERTHPRGPRYR